MLEVSLTPSLESSSLWTNMEMPFSNCFVELPSSKIRLEGGFAFLASLNYQSTVYSSNSNTNLTGN